MEDVILQKMLFFFAREEEDVSEKIREQDVILQKMLFFFARGEEIKCCLQPTVYDSFY
jgi:hypothetical protein